MRVNRNFIVNINAIQDVVAYSPKRLKIIFQAWEGKEDTLASRERVADLKKRWTGKEFCRKVIILADAIALKESFKGLHLRAGRRRHNHNREKF